jgi:hypothetical protein
VSAAVVTVVVAEVYLVTKARKQARDDGDVTGEGRAMSSSGSKKSGKKATTKTLQRKPSDPATVIEMRGMVPDMRMVQMEVR